MTYLKLKDQKFAFQIESDYVQTDTVTTFTRRKKDGTLEQWTVANDQIAYIQTQGQQK